ncbi:MAG: methylthioribulose 1-phosphate dehydratase [Cyanobium sp.]|uniref:methylthioribulose 1-phosphate dehydratase n=1 Tax=Synechococcus sp. CS-1333 TaxID=2848638 RepID=UPI000DBBDDF3|nr:methylthioribulose 1-phosphate dehydratase [Synechococcus sp. CS-1333]MCT0210630.1 methylthioribulose 1-phosphate dehydratase [Synechococcus sp. CS-1333]PZV19840.1 MAG: methylthioribulose 1-phosphate dehydratase [Cyanobium sp.]
MPFDPPTTAEALASLIRDLHRRGWCDGTGGNFSSVLNRDPLRLLMAPSGIHKGSVRGADLVQVNEAGAVVEGNGRASAETLLHLEIVQTCGAGAVLHTHSPAATLLSRLALQSQQPNEICPAGVVFEGLEMMKGLEGITTHHSRVVLPVVPNDQDLRRLSDLASPLLNDAPHGLLVGGHGLYAWGSNLFTAQRHVEILEFLLDQTWRDLLLKSLQPAAAELPVQAPQP